MAFAQRPCAASRCASRRRHGPPAAAPSASAPPQRRAEQQHAAAPPARLLLLRSSPAALPLLVLADAAASSASSAASAVPDVNPSLVVTLGLFLLSFPGLYSLVTRSAKSKIERKTFEVPGPAVAGAGVLDERARSLAAYFKRNNYAVAGPPGEVITFEGNISPERGTAAYITFCAFVGLGSAALVLSIAQPAIGDAAYWLTALSPAAGAYYWRNAARKESVRVKIVTSDDESTSDITIEGDANEIERCARELDMVEKGKIKVKGLLEPSRPAA